MIEGLRLARYFQETRRTSNYPGAKSCAECRERVDVTTRQDMGCVYEAPTEARQREYVLRPPLPWKDLDGKGIAPSACPLYLGRIADDSDVHAAMPHYRKGIDCLIAWLGRTPDRALLECLAALEWGDGCWDSDENGGRRKAGA